MTAPGAPTSEDLRSVIDDLLPRLGALPSQAWDTRAAGLTWTCRDTVAHLLDDLGFYALQLSGRRPPQTSYVPLLDPPPWREGSPPIVFWPDPAEGTAAVVTCLDAAAGLLAAVTARAAPDHRGFHPYGVSDRTGFAAMGIVEAACHGFDILTAHDVDYRADARVCGLVLDRLFPTAARTADPWHDLLGATGRTEQTRGTRWRWDSRVR